MATTIIVKNISGSIKEIEDLGIDVDTTGELNLTLLYTKYEILGSTDLNDLVSNGDLIINNGIEDLGLSDALMHINFETEYEDELQDDPNKLDIKKDGVLVAANVDSLNFKTDFNVISDSTGNVIVDVDAKDLPSVSIRRTSVINFSTSWTDTTFDTTDLESNTEVIEHDDINTDRINIKEDGIYQMYYQFQVYHAGGTRGGTARIRVNDNTILNESEAVVYMVTAGDIHPLSRVCIAELTKGDYISVQTRTNATPTSTYDDSIFSIVKLNGIKGEKGEVGEVGDPDAFDIYDAAGGQTFTSGTITLNLDTIREEIEEDDIFTLSSDEITIDSTGYFSIQFRVSTTISTGSVRSSSSAWLERDSGSGFQKFLAFGVICIIVYLLLVTLHVQLLAF